VKRNLLNDRAMKSGDASPNHDARSLSLVLGGPLYQLFIRSRLARPPLELLHRRIIALVLITWLPLAAWCRLKGTRWEELVFHSSNISRFTFAF
jgi:hypothetical protein